jgi:hypothetical protein
MENMTRCDFTKVKCKHCDTYGPEIIKQELDGGGPGNFWITTLHCLNCGHEAQDAYHDGTEWQR